MCILIVQEIQFNANKTQNTITFHTSEGEQSIEIGYGDMKKGAMSNPQLVSNAMAASGAWTTFDTYVVKIYFYETPHSVQYSFQFKEEQVVMDTELNVSFGPSKLQKLRGVISTN